jgi:hypothetical protein
MIGQIRTILQKFLRKQGIFTVDPHLFLLGIPPDICYRCGLACQLEAKTEESGKNWAEKLYNFCLTQENIGFDVIIQSHTFLDFIPQTTTLATFLETFREQWQAIGVKSLKTINISQYPAFNPFVVQYAQARAVQLRDLAIQEKLFTVNQPITWLSPQNQLNLPHLRERELFRYLILISDRLEMATPQEILKLTTGLSQGFLNLEKDCRIFGETYKNTPHLSLVRLKLIDYTEILLRDLLTHCFNFELLEL